MTEEKMYHGTLKPYLEKAGAFIQRIENTTGLGVPDIFVKPKNHPDMWIESKAEKKIPEIYRPDYRPGQLAWAVRYTARGGRWRLFVGTDTGMYFVRHPAEQYHISELLPFPDFNIFSD